MGLGSSSKNNGVLILLVMQSQQYDDGDYYVTLGTGFRNTTLEKQASALAQTMEDSFAAQDYDAAVTTCAQNVANTIADVYGVTLSSSTGTVSGSTGPHSNDDYHEAPTITTKPRGAPLPGSRSSPILSSCGGDLYFHPLWPPPGPVRALAGCSVSGWGMGLAADSRRGPYDDWGPGGPRGPRPPRGGPRPPRGGGFGGMGGGSSFGGGGGRSGGGSFHAGGGRSMGGGGGRGR